MYDSNRLDIPTKDLCFIAQELHAVHSGITKMLKTAMQLYDWPNMRPLLEYVVNNCKEVQANRPTHARREMEKALPSHASSPMSELGSDLYNALGKRWLVLADRYSGYVWNAQSGTNAQQQLSKNYEIGSLSSAGQTKYAQTAGQQTGQTLHRSAAITESNTN